MEGQRGLSAQDWTELITMVAEDCGLPRPAAAPYEGRILDDVSRTQLKFNSLLEVRCLHVEISWESAEGQVFRGQAELAFWRGENLWEVVQADIRKVEGRAPLGFF